jgi:beta-glucosidase
MKKIIIGLLATIGVACNSTDNNKNPRYLDASVSVEERIEDLMGRMTLEEKVAQMCQYVGLEHIKKAEKNLTKEEMAKSDAHGYYPDLHSSEIEKMVVQGMIGSFLHVLDVEEANYLQSLAQKKMLTFNYPDYE